MKDYYSILGVNRSAGDDEIKRAYRRLASQHHPDKGGDTTKFQEIQEAYSTLSDPQARQLYDNPHLGKPQFTGGPGFNFNDLFAQMFGQGFSPGGRQPQAARITLWISLADVARGGPRIISLQVHNRVQNVEIDLPAGINDGDTIRYPGLSPDGQDLVITYRVHPDPRWQRNGRDVTGNTTVDVWDLILGCEHPVEDVLGNRFMLTIPPMTQPGSLMRMRGLGLPTNKMPGRQQHGAAGDLFFKIQARIPNNIPPDLLEQLRRLRGGQ